VHKNWKEGVKSQLFISWKGGDLDQTDPDYFNQPAFELLLKKTQKTAGNSSFDGRQRQL